MKEYWPLFIGGNWVDAADGERIAVENPATAQVITEIAGAGQADVDCAVAAARTAFESRVLQEMRPSLRGELMQEVAALLRQRAEQIAAVESLDNGRNLTAAHNEVLAAARYFSYYGGAADKLEGRMIPLGGAYHDYTIPAPYGVSAQIVPWNFPLQIGARSIACALATANTVVLKSPELSPLSLYLLAEVLVDAGVPAGTVNIICGFGHTAGAALAAHGDIDHIVFTGSVPTGRTILKAAAERIIPCVMELGGKSAGIIYADANIEQAVNSTAIGIFTHSGQVCSACSRLLVHRSLHDEVVERLVAAAGERTVGPGVDGHDMPPLISAQQLAKVENYCQQAIEQGAAAACGGSALPGDGHFFPPTILTGVTPDMAVAQEELFGPVLVVIPFDTPEQAIALANGTDYGLVAGLYTQDLALAHWSAERLNAGQVFINEWFAGGVETPFGGTKRSGYGREKGQEGLLNYVQTKNVGIRLDAAGGGRPGG